MSFVAQNERSTRVQWRRAMNLVAQIERPTRARRVAQRQVVAAR